MKRILGYCGIGIFVAVLVWASYGTGLFSGVENSLEDILFDKKPVSSDVVIVAIDDASLARIGQWPWPRAVFKDLLEKMQAAPPRSVGIDVLFADASRIGKDDDTAFADALSKLTYPVVMPKQAVRIEVQGGQIHPSGEGLVEPLPLFLHTPVVTGHVNLIADQDGIVRRFPLVLSTANGPSQSFGQTLLDPIHPPVETGGVARIVYAGGPGTFPRIPLYKLLEKNSLLEQLHNKIVLIGVTAPDLHDDRQTPMGKGTSMPGVEVQANIVNMLLLGYGLVPLGRGPMSLWIILAALIPALSFILFRKSIKPLVINAVLGLVYLVVSIILFGRGTVVSVVHVQLAWIASTVLLFTFRYLIGERDRRDLRHIFSKYVSNDVLNVILQNPRAVKLGGEERNVTVFFSDIRGFTTISEKVTPTELVRILNKYFTAMTGIVLEHGGVVDKYIGDAIMAFWGAPLPDENQADRAVQASIAMIKALKILNAELIAAGDPEIHIGIGLFSGPAVVGNVGSDQRFDYTVMGDTVNAASRLESSNKPYSTCLLLSQSTKNLLKGDYPLVYVDEATVKGRSEPIKMYTIDWTKIK